MIGNQLPSFVTEEVLAKNGVVLLPSKVNVLIRILKFYDKISESFSIDFVDSSENLLCQVTNSVTDYSLWGSLGISGNQEDLYCNIADTSLGKYESSCTEKNIAIFKMIQQKHGHKGFIQLRVDENEKGWIDSELSRAGTQVVTPNNKKRKRTTQSSSPSEDESLSQIEFKFNPKQVVTVVNRMTNEIPVVKPTVINTIKTIMTSGMSEQEIHSLVDTIVECAKEVSEESDSDEYSVINTMNGEKKMKPPSPMDQITATGCTVIKTDRVPLKN